MQKEKEDTPAPAERGHDLYESGLVLTNGRWSKSTWVHRLEMVHNMIRPSRVEQSRQHQSLEQRGAGHRAKWPVGGVQQTGNDTFFPLFFVFVLKKYCSCTDLRSVKLAKHLKHLPTKNNNKSIQGKDERFNYTWLPGAEEKKRKSVAANREGGGLERRFNEIWLKHPIRYIQWISLFCLQKLYILTHKRVWLLAVQFSKLWRCSVSSNKNS